MIPENSTSLQLDGYIGHELNRPECVLAHSSGSLLTPCWAGNGGISLISPITDAQTRPLTRHILADHPTPLRPNGIALESGETVLLAHMGDTSGGIFRLFTDGSIEPCVTHINGQPMPPANFVIKDSAGRIWITVSTRITPRAGDYRSTASSGFIAVAQPGASEATIVADGLGYTNECVIDEHHGHVYVNETFGRRLTRFNLSSEAVPMLSQQHMLHTFGKGSYPDGLAMDCEGGLWITSIVNNRIMRIQPDGGASLCFEDSEESHLAWTEQAYETHSLGREHLDNAKAKHMKNISNVAFGGADLSCLYIGNLLGNTLPFMHSEIAGAPMTHWDVPLGELAEYLYVDT